MKHEDELDPIEHPHGVEKEQRQHDSNRYHVALMNGRHPRSYARSDELWKFVRHSTERVDQIKVGQRLSKVVVIQDAPSHKTTTILSLVGHFLTSLDETLSSPFLESFQSILAFSSPLSTVDAFMLQAAKGLGRETQNQILVVTGQILQHTLLPIASPNVIGTLCRNLVQILQRNDLWQDSIIPLAIQDRLFHQLLQFISTTTEDMPTGGEAQQAEWLVHLDLDLKAVKTLLVQSKTHPSRAFQANVLATAREHILPMENSTPTWQRYILECLATILMSWTLTNNPSTLQRSESTSVIPKPNHLLKKSLRGTKSVPQLEPLSRGISTTRCPVTPVVMPTSSPEALRQEFSQLSDTRLHYGSTMSLELFDQSFLMIRASDGQARIQPLSNLSSQPRDRVSFKIINLTDRHCVNPVKFGDDVWIQISSGSGESSNADHGSILGTEIRQAPTLDTISRSKKQRSTVNRPPPASEHIGHATPIRAFIPTGKEEELSSTASPSGESLGKTGGDEDLALRFRNRDAKMLGRWIIRSALKDKPNTGMYVCNNDEIVFEQDWFYLAGDGPSSRVVLRQLPRGGTKGTKIKSTKKITVDPTNHNSNPMKPPEYIVHRRGAWRLRIIDSQNDQKGLSLAQIQMERILYRAKNQLKRSKKLRHGELQAYDEPSLVGGATFPRQMRLQMQHITLDSEDQYFDPEAIKQDDIGAFFVTKYPTVGPVFRPLSLKHGKVREAKDELAQALTKTSDSDSKRLQGCVLCHSSTSTFHFCQVTLKCLEDFHRVQTPMSIPDTKTKTTEHPPPPSQHRIRQLLQQQDDRLHTVIALKKDKPYLLTMMHSNHYIIRGDSTSSSASIEESIASAAMAASTQMITPPSPLPQVSACDSSFVLSSGSSILSSVSDASEDPHEPPAEPVFTSLDIPKALSLYGHNTMVLCEMLLGFQEVVKSQLMPVFQHIENLQDKTLLIENADFLARAAEFVGATSVQKAVMSLFQELDDWTPESTTTHRQDIIDPILVTLLDECDHVNVEIDHYLEVHYTQD